MDRGERSPPSEPGDRSTDDGHGAEVVAGKRRPGRTFLVLCALTLAASLGVVAWISAGSSDRARPILKRVVPPPPARLPVPVARARSVPFGPDEQGLSPGPERDYSLPLNNPAQVGVDDATHMRDDDLVVGVVVHGRARAYPWWILRNFHVANDTLAVGRGDRAFARREAEPANGWWAWTRVPTPESGSRYQAYVPLLVTMCEVCGGASAFIPLVDGSLDRPLVFSQCRGEGSSAGRYAAAAVYTICDLETHSRWHPFTGRAESGPLAGQKLQRVPVFLARWSEWAERYPETRVVLAGPEMRGRHHADLDGAEPGGPATHPRYSELIRANPDRVDPRFPISELVLGIASESGGESIAYGLAALRKRGRFAQGALGDEPHLVLLRGDYEGRAYSRLLDGRVLEFSRRSESPLILEDESGGTWNEFGESQSGAHAGRSLSLLAHSYVTEWYEWHAEYPETSVVRR